MLGLVHLLLFTGYVDSCIVYFMFGMEKHKSIQHFEVVDSAWCCLCGWCGSYLWWMVVSVKVYMILYCHIVRVLSVMSLMGSLKFRPLFLSCLLWAACLWLIILGHMFMPCHVLKICLWVGDVFAHLLLRSVWDPWYDAHWVHASSLLR